jgi:hypothetical protein
VQIELWLWQGQLWLPYLSPSLSSDKGGGGVLAAGMLLDWRTAVSCSTNHYVAQFSECGALWPPTHERGSSIADEVRPHMFCFAWTRCFSLHQVVCIDVMALQQRVLHGGDLLGVASASFVSFPALDHVEGLMTSWVWFVGGGCGCAPSSLSLLCVVARPCWGLNPTDRWVVTRVNVPIQSDEYSCFFSFLFPGYDLSWLYTLIFLC